MSHRLLRLDPRSFVSHSRRLRRLDQRLRLRQNQRRLRLLHHLCTTQPVSTVLELEEVERIVVLARELGVSVYEMIARLIRTGLMACERDAAGDVEAPPVSTERLKRGAW